MEIIVAEKGVKLEAKDIENVETKKIILDEVLYVPELSKNVLSLYEITENQV